MTDQNTPTLQRSALATAVAAAQQQPQKGERAYDVVLRLVREKLIAQLTAYERAHVDTPARGKAERLMREVLSDYRASAPLQGLAPLDASDDLLVQSLLSDTLGFGVLDAYLGDEQIEEIIINGRQLQVIDEKGKHPERVDLPDEAELLDLVNRLVAPTGRQVNLTHPILDAQLPDGSRINVAIAPVASPSPAVTIRRHRLIARQMDDLIRLGTLDVLVSDFLTAAVAARFGILVSGGTASGKTNFLNVLASLFPADERVVVVEDTREVQLPVQDVVYLTTRAPSAEGTGEIPQRRLVQNALRMRPDRIVVGEVRGVEALDMLLASNTGHEGFMCTVHANSASQALTRLMQLTRLAPETNVDEKTLAEWIASAFHLVIFLKRDPMTGHRQVEEIVELSGVVEAGGRMLHQPIFKREAERGELVRTPYALNQAARLREHGIDPNGFTPRPHSASFKAGILSSKT
ncbi:MAG: CpaF family protein [Chloroflexi bacterium]|nr:CpaF family protein [Chloroflexota bacterium]